MSGTSPALTLPANLDRRARNAQVSETQTSAPGLLELAEQINAKHGELRAVARTTIERAIELGTLLNQVKARLEHGQWGTWLKSHTEISDRTARAWMQLADAVADGRLAKSVSGTDLTVTGVRKLIAKSRTETAKQPKGDSDSISRRAIKGTILRDFKRLSEADQRWVAERIAEHVGMRLAPIRKRSLAADLDRRLAERRN